MKKSLWLSSSWFHWSISGIEVPCIVYWLGDDVSDQRLFQFAWMGKLMVILKGKVVSDKWQHDTLSPIVFVLVVEYFSRSLKIGLLNKSQIYCLGVRTSHRNSIPTYTIFKGPASRMSASDCNLLVGKLSSIIKCWESRNLSYTGRLVRVNNVLLGKTILGL